MIDALHYEFMQNALIAALLAAVGCGVIGVYTVVKRMASISGGISHASFGGVGLGYYLDINPILGALLFALSSALTMGFVIKRAKLSEDIAIMAIWVTGMATGVLFIYLTPGYTPDPSAYLFGDILLVLKSDLIMMGILDAIIVLTVLLLYKEFLALSFDEEFGTVAGAPMRNLYVVLLCLIALTVVVLMKVVGIILVIALIVFPASTAKRFTHTLWKMMALSILLSMLATTTGLWLSYELDVPSAATVTLVSFALFLLSLIVSHLSGRHKTMTPLPKTPPS